MQTAVIYARYSSYGQTEQSIEGQVRECTEYARQNNILITGSYIDRAMTGTNDNRTDFQRMIKDSSRRAWDMVLVYKLDRFSRNKYEMAIHRKTLKDNGIRLVSVKENIPDTPEGIILESMLEGMAEYYSVELAQKVMRGQKETRIKGNYCGGGIPYGYCVEKIDGEKKYVVKEDEAAIVLRIFEEYAGGKICREIIEALTADGIYARDGKPFGRNALYNMLVNERYTGVYRHKRDGVYLNTFRRIVPQDLFDTVQRMLRENSGGAGHIPDPFLLREKLFCGYCGKKIRGDSGTSATGKVSKYYACAGRKQLTNKCRKQILRKTDLEQLVTEITLKALDDPKNVEPLVDRILELNEKRAESNSTLLILQSEMNECQKALDNLMKAMEQGVVTVTTKQRLEELESRREELKARLLAEGAKEKIKISKPEILKFIYKAIREEPAQMLRMLIKRIVLYDDKIQIYYNTTERKGPDEEDTHQAFCFYKKNFDYENRAWWFHVTGGGEYEIEVSLFI